MFYSATERQIYRSPLMQDFDPLALNRSLIKESKGEINQWLKGWVSEDPLLVAECEELLVKTARKVFGLKAFTEPNGHSDSQALAVLDHFLRYCEGKG